MAQLVVPIILVHVGLSNAIHTIFFITYQSIPIYFTDMLLTDVRNRKASWRRPQLRDETVDKKYGFCRVIEISTYFVYKVVKLIAELLVFACLTSQGMSVIIKYSGSKNVR